MLPPQQRIDENWYKGTADAIYQNIYTIEKANPRYVLILAGDHIYKMDYGDMIRSHIERGADLTIGCIPVPRKEGIHFGIMDVDKQDHVVGFLEKPRRSAGDARHARPDVWPRWVFTCSRPVPCSSCCARTPRAPTATTISARTSSRPSSARIACSPIASAIRTARRCRTGATWARWTPIIRPTWT